MLKFFQRIRRKLIDEGNLKRYLVYAIGEILLIMIGILLALQVSNWNGERILKSQAKLYKEKIIADLVLDTININNLINQSKRIQSNIYSYFHYFEQGNHSIDELIDSSLNVKWRYFQYLPNNHTLIDLQSSGKTGLLKEEYRNKVFELANKQDYLQKVIDSRINDVKRAIHERNKYLDFDPSESDFFDIVQTSQPKNLKIKGLLHQHYVLQEVLGFTGQMISFGSSVKNRTEKCLEILTTD